MHQASSQARRWLTMSWLHKARLVDCTHSGGVSSSPGLCRPVGLCKSLRVAVMICATLVNTQTHRHTDRQTALTSYTISSASWSKKKLTTLLLALAEILFPLSTSILWDVVGLGAAVPTGSMFCGCFFISAASCAAITLPTRALFFIRATSGQFDNQSSNKIKIQFIYYIITLIRKNIPRIKHTKSEIFHPFN